MKKIITMIAAIALALSMTVSAYAAGNTLLIAPGTSRVNDYADILSDDEEQALLDKVNALSEELEFDIVILTTNSLDGKTAEQYADDFYDQNGFGYGDEKDGALMLLDMGERAYAISTSGYGITALTDYGLDEIVDEMMGDLSSGDYAGAFNTFADKCKDFVTVAREETPYDTYEWVPDEPEPYPVREGTYFDPTWVIIGLVIGFILSLIITGSWKSSLKSVRQQYSAGSYIRKNSLNLTENSDRFLYSNIMRTPIPRNRDNDNMHHGGGHFVGGGSTTHMSSGGHSHGGTSGHF